MTSPHPTAPAEGRTPNDARDGVCSRCRKAIEGFRPPDGGMTAGYYHALSWKKYANPGEVIICDDCMWADPRYIADYGDMRRGN